MTPDLLRQIEELYHSARESSPEQRAALLARADPEIRRQVESLLARQSDSLPSLDVRTMTILHSGARLGPYQLESKLGEGGMGEVYRARDTRLGRLVAIKFLTGTMAADPAALERFRREAQAISALNHPNVCTLYDIGEHERRPYLVMELMDGQTLKERIASQPFTNDELIATTIPLLDALEAAHAAGIVHRDIKPANIFVTRQGAVKILDFGLAKSPAGQPDAPTAMAESLTAPGTTIGTISYMSPEQARGQNVDARSDLFACGVVLYQMATATLPFAGDSWAATVDAVLNRPPRPARELRREVSPEIERVIERALEKEPQARYQSAADMRADLLRARRILLAPSETQVAPNVSRSRRASVFYAAAGVAALLLLGVAGWYFSLHQRPVTSPSEYVQLTDFNDSAAAPAISPDGRMVAFFRGGNYFLPHSQIYVKLLPDGQATQLTNDANAKYNPVFTPDGSRVAYTVQTLHDWNTWTVPVTGGSPSLFMRNAAGLTWIGNGRVLFSEVMSGTVLHMGIVTSLESRADEHEIYFPDHVRAMAHYSLASPDRKSLLVVEMDGSGTWQRCRLVAMEGDGKGGQVGPQGACLAAGWSPDGRWMYFNTATSAGLHLMNGATHLWRQRFPDGAAEQITFGPGEEQGLAVAPDGRSLISSVGVRNSSVWIHDASGDRPISQEGAASTPKISADGKRVYYLVEKNASSGSELWSAEWASGKSNPSLPGVPMIDFDISPDGQQVAFTTRAGQEGQVFIAPLDRSAPPRLVVRGGDSVSFGAPGELVFRQLTTKLDYLARIKTDGSGLKRVLQEPILDKLGVSPDGSWAGVAGAGEDASVAVSLRDGTRQRVCDGLCMFNWSPDGAFFYVTPNPTPALGGRTLVLPVRRAAGLPALPQSGLSTNADEEYPVIRQEVAPGPDPKTYAFVKSEFAGNLFRIPLH
ncbi:MAG TPA: protein kinase [Bryobacteraceae bacterium]|nr:protein kinase [Bryobacteraceae bacterium]